MTKEKLDHYNPDYTYKKEDITIDKGNKAGYPMIEQVNNGSLYPEAIKNSIDMQDLNTFD
ncbi:hypothetical protein G9F72_002380 [Clostridium estertheticum]|uniref:hypothetical protein n=1 Tax=Clostridium estertheticum TaxID=238834 RepID=UPI0013E92B50|nr:hypothetical protein [Clostridium estertheticum]MBZ9685200.1 hypothetical protein [Clostridium estertheticum]